MLCLCEPVHAPTSSVLARCCSHSSHVLPAASVRVWATETWAERPRFLAGVWKSLEKPDELPSFQALDFVADGLALGLPPALRASHGHPARRPAVCPPIGLGLGHRPGTPAPPTRPFPAPAPGWGQGQPNGSPVAEGGSSNASSKGPPHFLFSFLEGRELFGPRVVHSIVFN